MGRGEQLENQSRCSGTQGSGGVTIPESVKKQVDVAFWDMVQQAWWCWGDGWT